MLSALGNLLDLPGSMARDALMLRNPLDQVFDPFGQGGRTSGQEMLDAVGLQNSPWLSMGLEMALDPTSYVGVGAANAGLKGLGLGGKLAGAGGKLGKAAKLAKFAARHPQRAINAAAAIPRYTQGMPSQIFSKAKSGLADFFGTAAGKADELKKAVMGGSDELAQSLGGVADDAVEQTAARSVENAASVTSHPIPKSLGEILGDQYLQHLPADQIGKVRDVADITSEGLRMEQQAMEMYYKDYIAKRVKNGGFKNRAIKAPARRQQVAAAIPKAIAKQEQEAAATLYEEMVKQYMPKAHTAAPVMSQAAPAAQVAPEAIAQAMQPSRFANAMDKTIYNPDVMRLLLGGALPYTSSIGRSTNPTSHAYAGY